MKILTSLLARITALWVLLFTFLLVLAGMLSFYLYYSYHEIYNAERNNLLHQANIVNINLSRELLKISNELDGIGKLIANKKNASEPINESILSFLSSFTDVKTILYVDKYGIVKLSNQRRLLGLDVHELGRYEFIANSNKSELLYITEPFITPLGSYAIGLARVIQNQNGEFNGYVMAILTPNYFHSLLSSVLYTPDVFSTIIHNKGKVIYKVPNSQYMTGNDLKKLPKDDFWKFIKEDKHAAFTTGLGLANEKRLIVFKSIKSELIRTDGQLIYKVSRDLNKIFASWVKQAFYIGILFSLLCLISITSMVTYQRRLASYSRLQELREKEKQDSDEVIRLGKDALYESESRWRFALEGSGDGLWDWNARNNSVFFSHQWKSMLGYSDDEISNHLEEWEQRIHPDDREAALHDVQEHLEGNTPFYVNEHRLLCKDGSYKWILDRGMVIERSKDGKPLRVIGTHTDVTTRRNAEELLRLADERLNLAVAFGDIGVWDLDLTHDKVWRSEKHDLIFGFSNIQPEWVQESWIKHILDEDRQIFLKAFADAYATGRIYVEFRITHQDQSIHWVSLSGRAICNDNGLPIRMLGIVTDITQRKNVEEKLRIAATTFESQEGLLITDASNHIISVNKAFTRITGYTEEDAVGKKPNMFRSGIHDKSFYAAMWDSIIHEGRWSGEIMNRRKDGEIYPERLLISAVKDKSGQICNYVASIMDLTEAKVAIEKINNLAFYDPLTKLPNRRLLFDRLQHAMASSARSCKKAALLFLDIDNFKNLNDTLGHSSGDILLKQVAERLTNVVREGDTVARVGGDEFVVLLEGLSEQTEMAISQIESITNKLQNLLSKKYRIATHVYSTSVSIGISLLDNNLKNTEDVLKQADIAMYKAKESGKNSWRIFDPEMQRVLDQRVLLESELRLAIEFKQFELYYQVQVDNNRLPIGAEALIRWQHPQRGLVSPFHFIQLAEDTGLILPIGKWVLETACEQLELWKKNGATRELSISVNVSAKQFHQPDFVYSVKDTLSRYEIDPAYLKLEITESMLLADIQTMIQNMMELKKMGIRFELDDFGTGYSSLQYLKELPLSELKIDQSFVRDIMTDDSDRTLVRTIISMAHSLDLKVIAEGVESEDQLQFLKANGCDHYQGYFFSKPVTLDEFELLLNK